MTASITQSDQVLRKRFGAWLKRTREDIGLTQLDLAITLDYAYPTTVSQIERGLASLPQADLRAWAEALRCSVPQFAAKYLYHYHPFVYEALHGENPYEREQLVAPDSPVMQRAHPRGSARIRPSAG